ncbi:hypothetical protein Ancab_036901 [Ancistrocladus abbreviatus]
MLVSIQLKSFLFEQSQAFFSSFLLNPTVVLNSSFSFKVTPYNAAVTPNSSLEFRGKIGESSYCLKTSAELLLVNRIWSLEEEQRSNISLARALSVNWIIPDKESKICSRRSKGIGR